MFIKNELIHKLKKKDFNFTIAVKQTAAQERLRSQGWTIRTRVKGVFLAAVSVPSFKSTVNNLFFIF